MLPLGLVFFFFLEYLQGDVLVLSCASGCPLFYGNETLTNVDFRRIVNVVTLWENKSFFS